MRITNYCVLVMAVCFGCSAGRVPDVAGVLEQGRHASVNLRADIIFERNHGNWRVSGISLCNVDPVDYDLGRLAVLTDLESLEVDTSWDGMNGKTPQSIRGLGTFPHLQRLVLYLKVTEEYMEAIGSLTELQELDLPRYQGAEEGLKQLKGLQRLRRLYLGMVSDNVSLEYLKLFKGLEDLDLHRNDVSEECLAVLKGLRNLRSLILHVSERSGSGFPSVLKNLPQLERISVSGSCAGDLDLSLCGGLRSVDVGYLERGKASKIRLPDNVVRLTFSRDMAKVLGLQRPPPHLQSVTVVNAGGDVDMKWLNSLPDLRELGLEYGIESAVKVISGLRSLRALSLKDCQADLSNEGMKRIGELRQLESLEIEAVDVLVRVAGMRELGNLKELRRLRLAGLYGVTDEGLACLGELKHLSTLILGFAEQIPARPADGVLAVVQTLVELEELSIYGATLTDTGLKDLANLKMLRRLDLTGCYGYTDDGLRTLMQALPNLQTVKRSYKPR